MTEAKLPALPMPHPPKYSTYPLLQLYYGQPKAPAFSLEEMQSFYAAGFRAGMERAAVIAEEHCADAREAPFKDYEDTHVDGYQDAANDIESAIRSEIGKNETPK